jgi:RNA polymerase sigma-70 factor (ECF subfamily)
LTGAVSILPRYQTLGVILDDSVLIQRLQKQDEAAFEQVFKTYYKNLHGYAFTMIKDEAAAEETVQQVFFKLWERTENLSISGSVQAYLYRAVYNESLNYLKHQKVRTRHQLFVKHRREESTEGSSKGIHVKELEAKISAALNELPEQCRTVFQLSRFEELRYKEIADHLQISVKTVENQMGKALKLLRSKLADFLILIFIFIQSKS